VGQKDPLLGVVLAGHGWRVWFRQSTDWFVTLRELAWRGGGVA
jgi:hypothetical protein